MLPGAAAGYLAAFGSVAAGTAGCAPPLPDDDGVYPSPEGDGPFAVVERVEFCGRDGRPVGLGGEFRFRGVFGGQFRPDRRGWEFRFRGPFGEALDV
jgi:hypothetical protein